MTYHDTTRRLYRHVVTALALVTALLVVGGCGDGSGQKENRVQEQAQKTGDGTLRTDVEPLTKRFGAILGPSFQARWMSGRYGSPDNPGPSTYWLDAVITLDRAKVAELTTKYQPTPTSETPAVVTALTPHLPPGPYQTSATLTGAFKQGEWGARAAYLRPDTNNLVLLALSGA